jgi:hypothetical protein
MGISFLIASFAFFASGAVGAEQYVIECFSHRGKPYYAIDFGSLTDADINVLTYTKRELIKQVTIKDIVSSDIYPVDDIYRHPYCPYMITYAPRDPALLAVGQRYGVCINDKLGSVGSEISASIFEFSKGGSFSSVAGYCIGKRVGCGGSLVEKP